MTESFTAPIDDASAPVENANLIPSLVDVPDLVILPEDIYQLQIVGAKSDITAGKPAEGKLPRPFINLVCKALGYPNAETIFHKLWFPIAQDDLEKRGTMLRMMKEFCKATGMPLEGGFAADAFIGKEFKCILQQREFNGRITNEVKRLC